MFKHFTLTVCLPLLIGLGACQTATAPVDKVAEAPASQTSVTTLNYKKGEVLSFVFIDSKDGDEAEAARLKYYGSAFPLANSFGLSSDTTLSVAAIPVGNFKPDALGIFSWPDAASEAAVSAHPDWPGIKAIRPLAWDELRVATSELDADLTLSFDPAKTYTLASAWFNPENPNDYAKYMDGIKSSAEELGGRFVYKMHHPKLESHSEGLGAPGQITLVEWETQDGLAKFGKTKGFKDNVKYLSSGTTRFEIIVIAPQTKRS